MKNFYLDNQRFAGFFPRLFAEIIDTAILFPLYFLEKNIFLRRYPLEFLTCFIVISIFITYGYRPLFVGLKGWTPGKYLMKLRVVNSTGDTIGIKRGLIRYIVSFIAIFHTAHVKYLIASFIVSNPDVTSYSEAAKAVISSTTILHDNLLWILPSALFGIVDICFLIFNSRHRALHDFMAGSYVIKVKKDKEEEWECTECGATVSPDATVCPKCGADVSEIEED